MNLKFIRSGEKKKLVSELDEQFGIAKLPNLLLIETGKEKIRGFSGSMTIDEIKKLSEIANIEIIGLYLFKKELGGLRLSLDGSNLLRNEIKKNVIDINNNEFDRWIRGHNLDKKLEKGFYAIKSGEDFIGCGISDGMKLINFVPKERRIRSH